MREQIVSLLNLVELEAVRDERAKINPARGDPGLLHAAPLGGRQVSARAKPGVADGLAPHLLVRHSHDERLEISTREIGADVLQASRQVFSQAVLSALETLRIEIERVRDSRRASSIQPFCN
jgi:hypothetical protein